MKHCFACETDKHEDCFYKNKSTKDGLSSQCKNCAGLSTKKYRKTEIGILKHREAQNKFYQTDKGKTVNKKYATSEKGKLTNKKRNQSPKYKAAKKAYNRTEKAKKYEYEYNHSNGRKKAAKKYQQSTRGRNKAKQYKQRNPGKVNHWRAKYRADKLQRTPKWLTLNQLKEIKDLYTTAKELSWLSDGGLHVDHIIPLRGENVSGLHVPWNLQILTEEENIKKGNRFPLEKA